MKKEEFYKKYANTPIGNRYEAINIIKYGLLTLAGIYKRIKEIDDELRPTEIERQKLLNIAEDYYYFIKKNRGKKPKGLNK